MKRLVLLVLLVACKDAANDYAKKSKAIEADLMLMRLEKAAKRAHDETKSFPIGKAHLTPATSCCPDKCKPDSAQWAAAPWSSLDFSLVDPHLFQYSYESNGETYKATAVGDLDCDTDTITYTLTGAVVNGNVETKLEKPARID